MCVCERRREVWSLMLFQPHRVVEGEGGGRERERERDKCVCVKERERQREFD